MIPELDKEEWKALVKEALQEWLDRQFALFGKWSMAGLFSIALAGLLFLYLTNNGFQK